MAITAKTIIDTESGGLNVSYHKTADGEAVSFRVGDITGGEPVVRFHSACLFGEAFGSLHCDCSPQLKDAVKKVVEHGSGVVVYTYDEGMGIGLEKKIESMEIERTTGCSVGEAYKQLGFDDFDARNFAVEVGALKDLGVSSNVRFFSSNEKKIGALEAGGFNIVDTLEVDDSQLGEQALKERQERLPKRGGYAKK